MKKWMFCGKAVIGARINFKNFAVLISVHHTDRRYNFNILRSTPFPQLNLVSLDEFMQTRLMKEE